MTSPRARSGPRRSSLPARVDGRPPSVLARVAMGLLSAVVLLVSVGGWASYTYFNGNVTRVALNLGGKGSPRSLPGVQNYLLVGTDSRAGSDGAFGNVPGQRSDTTILIHIAADGTATMLSFPRDTYVTIPEYTDSGGTPHSAQKNKFNAAISLGGPLLLVRLVQNLTGMRVDHYVSMDLEGFKSITKAIGGVQVCVLKSNQADVFYDDNGVRRVSYNTHDSMSGFIGGPGTITVSGDQALAFVRQRHGLPGGDIDRIHRQQQFIGAVFRKTMTGNVLSDPLKLERLVSAATSALTLDDKTSVSQLRTLATQMRGVAAGKIRMETIPTHAPLPSEGAVDLRGDVLIGGQRAAVEFYQPADLEKLVAPLGGHADGYVPPSPGSGTGSTAGGTGSTAAVAVTVYNGTSIAGLASKAVAAFTARGFSASSGGNAASRAYVTTRVIYAPGNEAAANAVHALLPGSRLETDSSLRSVEVIVGTSYSGLAATPVAASSAPSASAGARTAPATPATTGPPPPPSCTY